MKGFFRQEILDAPFYRVDHDVGVKLSQNECPWDIPLALKVKISERLLKIDWNRYPLTELLQLQKKIARWHGIMADQVAIANGSNVLIQALVNIIPQQGKVLILDPTFVVYEMQAALAGHKVIKVPLSENFELLTEKTLATIKKEGPNLVLIANPNAPTGTLFDKMSLHRILEAAKCPVVIDEAYYPFTDETVLSWLNDFDHLIVMRTFSKAFALAGVRCGYLMGAGELTEQLEKFLMSFRLSTLAIAIVEEVIDNHAYVKEYAQKIVAERSRVFAEMQKIDNVHVFHSAANFLLFRVPDAAQLAKKLMKGGIIVRNVGNGGALENCLRVGIGSPQDNDTFLSVLKKSL